MSFCGGTVMTCSRMSTRMMSSTKGMMKVSPEGAMPWYFPSRVIKPFSYCLTVRAPLASAVRQNSKMTTSRKPKNIPVSMRIHLTLRVTPSTEPTVMVAPTSRADSSPGASSPTPFLSADFHETGVTRGDALGNDARLAEYRINVGSLVAHRQLGLQPAAEQRKINQRHAGSGEHADIC